MLNIRVTDVVFGDAGRQRKILVLHCEVDQFVHFGPEVRIAPGQAMEGLVPKDLTDEHFVLPGYVVFEHSF